MKRGLVVLSLWLVSVTVYAGEDLSIPAKVLSHPDLNRVLAQIKHPSLYRFGSLTQSEKLGEEKKGWFKLKMVHDSMDVHDDLPSLCLDFEYYLAPNAIAIRETWFECD